MIPEDPHLLVGQRFKIAAIPNQGPPIPDIRIVGEREALIDGEWHLRPLSGPVYLYKVEDSPGQYAECRGCMARSTTSAVIPFPEASLRSVTWAQEHRCPRQAPPPSRR